VLYERLLKNPQNLKGEKIELSPLYEPIRPVQTSINYYHYERDNGTTIRQDNIYKARYNGREIDVEYSHLYGGENYWDYLTFIKETVQYNDDGTVAYHDSTYKTRRDDEVIIRSQGTYEFAYANFFIKQHDVKRMLGLAQRAYVTNSPDCLGCVEEDFEDGDLYMLNTDMLYTPENSPFCRAYIDAITDYPEKDSAYNRKETIATLIDSNGSKRTYEVICDGGTANMCRARGGELGIRFTSWASLYQYAGNVYVVDTGSNRETRWVYYINPDTGAAEEACYAELNLKKTVYYDTVGKYPKICEKVIKGNYTEYKPKNAKAFLTSEQIALFEGFSEKNKLTAADYDNDGKKEIFVSIDCASGAGSGYDFDDIQLLNFDNGSIDALSFKEGKNGLKYFKGVAREPREDRCFDGFGEMDFGGAVYSGLYLLPINSSRRIVKIDGRNYLLILLNIYNENNPKWTPPNRLDLLVTKDNVTTAENICKFKQKRVYK
jgi:hypothetical protein